MTNVQQPGEKNSDAYSNKNVSLFSDDPTIMSSSAHDDLIPESIAEVRKLKKEICGTDVSSNERLSSTEFAGDFALRYVLMTLLRDKQVRAQQRKRRCRRQRRNGPQ
jgi:hypothetical protein